MSLFRSGIFSTRRAACFAPVMATALPALAQVSVVAEADHVLLLASSDAKAAANTCLVYDFWREVFEGGHRELADKYLAGKLRR